MNLSELLLNIKVVDFNSLVPQTDIQTEEDKQKYLEKGYLFALTEKEFREKFEADPACIWYTPSISQSCIYFNKDTLAVSLFPIEYLVSGMFKEAEGFYRVIQERETEVENKNFQSSISCLPDAMRLEYFKLILDKFGADISGLYDLFFSTYIMSDYGFGNIDEKNLSVILNSKTEEDIKKTEQQLKKLPEILKVYRGGNSASTPYEEAYSWTLDINTANFFACRHGFDEGYIVEGEVLKKDVIEAFLTDRNEQEIIVNPKDVNIISNMQIKGMNYIEDTLPVIAPMYRKYIEQMEKLTFAMESPVHGCGHEARVLLLALTIAQELNLPSSDKKILATAAIYHDTQRVHDNTDEMHGKTSREYYHNNVKSPESLVEFLCEYHCMPDEDGYREIMNNRQLSKNRKRSKLLIDIFKDADALERVRFGIKGLDMNQLRLPVSKELALIARIYLEQIKVNMKVKYASRSLDDKIRDVSQKQICAELNTKRNHKGLEI